MTQEDIKKYIYQLELSLLQPETRRDRTRLDEIISDDFMECGSSGKIYNKEEVITALSILSISQIIIIKDFAIRQLSDEIILATYHLSKINPNNSDTDNSFRSSIWRKIANSWQITFHQGTPL